MITYTRVSFRLQILHKFYKFRDNLDVIFDIYIHVYRLCLQNLKQSSVTCYNNSTAHILLLQDFQH
jgi:hypothetical protein